MHSKARTVDQYLEELPADRREILRQVRQVILRNLDKDIVEGMSYGMIGYYVPHSVYPAGYHCNPKSPLPFAGLASQKGYFSLYLMCLYGHSPLAEWFKGAWARTGKKLDMGKACIRFQKVEDLALDVIGETLRRVSARAYIEVCEKALTKRAKKAKVKAPVRKARKATVRGKVGRGGVRGGGRGAVRGAVRARGK